MALGLPHQSPEVKLIPSVYNTYYIKLSYPHIYHIYIYIHTYIHHESAWVLISPLGKLSEHIGIFLNVGSPVLRSGPDGISDGQGKGPPGQADARWISLVKVGDFTTNDDHLMET